MCLKSVSRTWAILAASAWAFPTAGCTDAPSNTTSNYWQIYAEVLGRVTAELELNHTLALHPLLGQIGWESGGAGAPMGAFNLSDTLVVKSFVDANSADYHLCTLTPQMTCDGSFDPVHVILSEIEELAERRVDVLVLVVDGRSPPGARDYLTANLHLRGGRWRVASFRRTR
jgi:hypothetical protein